jgi:hypothetical protein
MDSKCLRHTQIFNSRIKKFNSAVFLIATKNMHFPENLVRELGHAPRPWLRTEVQIGTSPETQFHP